MTTETAADLRRLHEEATPGPWEADEGRPYNSGLDPIDEGEFPSIVIPSPDPYSRRVCWINSIFSDQPAQDATLIAEARNALPYLLDVVDAARPLAEMYRERLMQLDAIRDALDALDAHLRGER